MNTIITKLLLIISLIISITNIKNNISNVSIIGVNLLYIMLILQHSLLIKYNIENIKTTSYINYYNKSIPILLLFFMLFTHPWLKMNLICKLNILLIFFLYYFDISGTNSKFIKKIKWKNKLQNFLFIVNLVKIYIIFLPERLFMKQLTIIAINTIMTTIMYYNNPINYYHNWHKLMSFAPIYGGFL